MKESTEDILNRESDVQYGTRKCEICDSRVTMSGGKPTCPKHGQISSGNVYVDNAD